MRKEIELEGWEYLTDKEQGTEYYSKKFYHKHKRFLEGYYILSKPIDVNLKITSLFRIDKYSLGSLSGCIIYIGKCPLIEDFKQIIKYLDI